jgi:hypothetical protein
MEYKVKFLVLRSFPLVPILSQKNPIHIFLPHFSVILILSSHLRLGLPTGLSSSGQNCKKEISVILGQSGKIHDIHSVVCYLAIVTLGRMLILSRRVINGTVHCTARED